MSSLSPRARLGVLGLLVTSTTTACGVRQLPPSAPSASVEVAGAPEGPPEVRRLSPNKEDEPAEEARTSDGTQRAEEKAGGTDVPAPGAGASERSRTDAYLGGVMLTFVGSGLTLLGGLSVAGGLATDPTVEASGNASDGKGFVVVGGVIGTVGVAALVTGIVFLASGRAEPRPASTPTFAVKR